MNKDDIANQISDATIASMTTRWGMGGGMATSIVGYLSSTEMAVFIGVVITIAGFILNSVFQWKREKRSRIEWQVKEDILKQEAEQKEIEFQAKLKRDTELHQLKIQRLKQEVYAHEFK